MSEISDKLHNKAIIQRMEVITSRNKCMTPISSKRYMDTTSTGFVVVVFLNKNSLGWLILESEIARGYWVRSLALLVIR